MDCGVQCRDNEVHGIGLVPETGPVRIAETPLPAREWMKKSRLNGRDAKMHLVHRLIALAAFAAAALPDISLAQTSAQELDRRCENQVSTELENPFGTLRHYRMQLPGAKFVGFFSTKINGCVAGVKHARGNRWAILDTQNRFLGDHSALFTCDRGGVNNVILEKARKYKGPDFHKYYKAFLDDGKGGVAKRLRKSSTRYSVQDCRKAYDKKIRELRSGERINK